MNKYDYVNDCKSKNEDCPSNTKNCGIIDNEENKLCLPTGSQCPINIITETKPNDISKYITVKIGNKTFYYGNDDSDKNRKIIAGLYVDSDLLLNENEKDYVTLDTYTISGLLKENNILYKDVNLGFDPYTEKNIDSKGKSYLKIRYNKNNVDIINKRNNYQKYVVDKKMNDEVIIPIKNNMKKPITYSGIVSYIALIIFCLLLMFCGCSIGQSLNTCCKCLLRLIYMILIIVFISFSFLAVIFMFKNLSTINKAKDIDPSSSNSFKIVCIIYIVIVFIIYILLIPLIIIAYRMRKTQSSNDITNKEVTINTNTNSNINSNSDLGYIVTNQNNNVFYQNQFYPQNINQGK